MIITKQKVRIFGSGKNQLWKSGRIQLSKEVMDAIGWEEQEVCLAVCSLDESLTLTNLKQQLETFQKIIELQKELRELNAKSP